MSGIYIASKAKHGPRWVKLRDSGVPIISTWIDESAPGATLNWGDLWGRCIREASDCHALVCYMEPGEKLNGAIGEVGAALSHDRHVFVTGPDAEVEQHSIFRHPLVYRCFSLESAIHWARQECKRAEEGRI